MARIISKYLVGTTYVILNCLLQNIVAHTGVELDGQQRLDIQRMYRERSVECTYQKNQFPGLIFRGKDYPVVMLCFYSGKIVLTGGKSIADIHEGWERLWVMVKKYVGKSKQ